MQSTALDDSATVTMQWRRRQRDETDFPRTPVSPAPPAGGWLASDVVRIGGVADSVSYALQMLFDDRINLALDGPIMGTVANEFPNLYLAEFNAEANQWANAALLCAPGEQPQPGVLESLSSFLLDNADTPLADLRGCWGVDPSTSRDGPGSRVGDRSRQRRFRRRSGPRHAELGQRRYRRAEPSAIVLLGMAAVSLGAYFACRRRKCDLGRR